MSEQQRSNIEKCPFFIALDKKFKYNKHFMSIVGTTVTCTVCKTDIPLDMTYSHQVQTSFVKCHVRKENHLKNVMNYIFYRAFPGIWEVNNLYKIINKNCLYCVGCKNAVGGITDVENVVTFLKCHNFSNRHREKLSKMQLLSTQMKTVKTQNFNHPAASTSTSLPVTTSLCSVCESPIEVFNQDLLLSHEVHKQSEQHLSTCHKKLKSIFVKYRNGDKGNFLTELFHIYPILFDQLVNCELFIDNKCYFLCSICKIQIPSVNVLSVNDEIYRHLRSCDNCKNEYLNKIFDEHLGTQNGFTHEASTGKDNYDKVSELFQNFPPYLKNNAGVISVVGDSLYCTVCSCYVSMHSDRSLTLKNLKVHLETVHCENLLTKVFELIPDRLQSNKKFIFYKGDFIMCSLCNITGITYKPLKIKQTATCIMEHLNGKQHQNNLSIASTAAQPATLSSTVTNQSPETPYSTKGKLIESLLLQDPKATTLLKQNYRFLQVQNKDFLCTLCQTIIASDHQASIKTAYNNIIQHFSSKKHKLLMVTGNKNQKPNVSLWKLVYDCYAPESVKSNEECVQKVGDKFTCTVCSSDIYGKEVKNVMEQIVKHVTSEQHNLIKVFAKLSINSKS